MDRNKYVVQCRKTLGVALRKESVDRNINSVAEGAVPMVALRKESVDRNNRARQSQSIMMGGRSPQGERG